MNGQPVMTSLERPVSGNWFRGTPSVSGDGVMEIGKYIDFHDSNSTTADFSVRLTTNGSMLTSSGTLEAPIIKATGNGKSGELGTGGGDVYLHNTKGNSYWQFKDNGHFGIPNHLVFQGSDERRVFLEGTNKGLYFNSSSFGFYDWANNVSLLRIDLNNKEIRTDSGYFATSGARMITSRAGNGYISWGNSTDWKYSCAFYTNTGSDAAAPSLTKGAPTIKMYSGSGGGLHLFPAGDAAGGMVICKGTGWVEILGCGMVDPNVLESCGIDSTQYTGYALGMGIERITNLKYRVKDLRMFSENDVRFLEEFESAH